MVNNQQYGNFVPNRNVYNPYFNSSPAGVSTSTNNIVQVQGIEGAKAYQLNPSSMAILLDSEAEGKMYIKVSDNIGMSNLRIFNYMEEVPSSAATVNQDLDLSAFVRKDELSKLIKEIIADEQPISTAAGSSSELTSPAPAKPKVTFIGNSNKQS